MIHLPARVALLAAAAALWLSAAAVSAGPGVGVNVAEIAVDEALKSGGGYTLPVVGVINTGDLPGDYELHVTYDADQPQRRPPASWFDFHPRQFTLQPNETRQVDIELRLPTGAEPGDYFAFLEARPVATTEGVSIGIAAATKLSFTVEPTSWLAAQRLRLSRALRDLQPWPYAASGLLLGGAAFYLARRYLPYGLRSPFERRR